MSMKTEAGIRPRSASTVTGRLRDFAVACRPAQWQKNALLFAAFIFSSGAAWTPSEPSTWIPLVLALTLAFTLFSAISSGGYLINDVVDVERDRLHERKRRRPIASGRIPVAAAVALGVALVGGGILGGLAISLPFTLAAAAYALLTISYSVRLKHIVIVDVLMIAFGFTVRALAGAIAIAVPVSPWLLACTTLGALFVAVEKRRQEFVFLDEGAAEHRSVLGEYTLSALDQMSSVATSATIVAYTLYVVSAENLPTNHTMLLTLPFVLYGLFRYRLIAEGTPSQNADELIARDLPLLTSVVLFGATALAVLTLG